MKIWIKTFINGEFHTIIYYDAPAVPDAKDTILISQIGATFYVHRRMWIVAKEPCVHIEVLPEDQAARDWVDKQRGQGLISER